VAHRIEEFITAVEQALIESRMSPQERQNVQEDLRVQIEEMLAARQSESQKPATLEDIEAVLAAIDPPESYLRMKRFLKLNHHTNTHGTDVTLAAVDRAGVAEGTESPMPFATPFTRSAPSVIPPWRISRLAREIPSHWPRWRRSVSDTITSAPNIFSWV